MLTTMLYLDKSIFKLSYTDVYTSKRHGNANFGEEYQHLDDMREHVETYLNHKEVTDR